MANNKFKERQYEAELLGELYDIVARKEKDIHFTWGVIAENDHQAKDWRTGEPLWEDEEQTIPKMKNTYGDIEKDELSEDDKLKITVYKRVMAALEKML